MDISVLTQDFLGHPVWLWASFMVFVFTLLFVDLFVLNKKDHVIELKESLRLASIYASLGLLFGLWVWHSDGGGDAADYYTVWLLELSLSMDNLFVMSVIFSSFAIPRQYQHRVLVWGILGVVVLRGIMIAAGSALVQQYTWVLMIFAAILILTGIKLLKTDTEEKEDYTQKGYVRFLKKHLRVDDQLHGNQFFVRLKDAAGKPLLYATPLFLTLCTIELTDVMFAFDSVPAALAVTTDPYIVYTANIFAILGLRAMFFAIEHIIHRFEYLKYSLSIVLILIGCKVFYVELTDDHLPAIVSLAMTVGVLAGGIVLSMLRTKKGESHSHTE
ncbi:MAG: TerC family protein [Micavibrio aeruginosavorus]|uniref:TerC family protein n=1 Tax=Micavibrio aeruginosavorus TaxID=349221 RepID=A0A2W5Q4F5_9BACT|nr:MAG: TerC family protein [Micavibrio aeruginosavorus]